MYIWETQILAEVIDVVKTLRTEIRSQGIDLLRDVKLTHNNIMVTCINHADGTEKKPSLGISTVDVIRNGVKYEEGTCHCFTCGYTADLPTFISNSLGYNDKGMKGFKWLTQHFHNVSVENRQPIKLDMSRERKVDNELSIITEEELAKYRYTHPYMYERKLTDKVIDYFDIGFDKEKKALTFPVHDLQGNVRLIQRRAVGRKQFINDEGANKGNYIYGLYQVYKNLSWIKELYITESPIDALTCWVHRVPAVALMGSSATRKQIEQLRELPIRTFVSALDNDRAGEEGHSKLLENLSNTKFIYRMVFPEGVKDINAMTTEQFENRTKELFKSVQK